MSEAELERLVEKVQEGDEQALEALLSAVQPRLYRFSMKMCRHTHDAEDVLQDSMMSVARSIRGFRGASSLSTWLFTIARSFCIKKRRKSKFAPTSEESLEQLSPGSTRSLRDMAPTPLEQAEKTAVWAQVQAGIAALEPAYREILVLRDIEGLSAKEVAEITDLSVSAVKSRLHRARSLLRASLTNESASKGIECPDIRAIFSQHLEGDLSDALCTQMQAHVDVCKECATECHSLKELMNACNSAPCEMPQDVHDRIMRRLGLAKS